MVSVRKIINDISENMVDRQDDKLENERTYYYYDRGNFQKKYFKYGDRYDEDIETISTLIKQINLFGEIIYDDGEGVMNSDIDTKFMSENLSKVDELRSVCGEIGIIFMKYVYDTLDKSKKVKYLEEFRRLVFDLMRGRDENTEELSTQMKTLKSNMKNQIEGGISDVVIDGLVDEYVFNSTKLLDRHLQKIGFDKNSLDKFFQEVIKE